MAAPPVQRRQERPRRTTRGPVTSDGRGLPPSTASGHLAGVDVGGTKLQVVVTDPGFEVRGSSRAPTPQSGGPAAVVAAICDLVSEAVAQAGSPALDGVGVGAPGSVDPLPRV